MIARLVLLLLLAGSTQHAVPTASPDSVPAQRALENWIEGTLGVNPEQRHVVLAAVEPDGFLISFTAGTRGSEGGFARMRLASGSWSVAEIYLEGPEAWVSPEAYAHQFLRRRVMSTMGDMRTLATAAESYSIDNNQYPVTSDLTRLSAALTPTYIRAIPLRDGWGTPLEFVSNTSDYCVVSLGAGGKPDSAGPRTVDILGKGSGMTHDPSRDLVFCTGAFVSWYE